MGGGMESWNVGKGFLILRIWRPASFPDETEKGILFQILESPGNRTNECVGITGVFQGATHSLDPVIQLSGSNGVTIS
jgi:hypothetical protein